MTDTLTQYSQTLGAFQIEGDLEDVVVHRRGHIHLTLISTWRQGERRVRYLHQKMNENVFPDVPGLMGNIEAITQHLRRKREAGQYDLQTLSLVPAREGQYLSEPRNQWRTFAFIDGSHTFDQCVDAGQAYESAKAFGAFQAALGDLPPSRLVETIPRFFESPYRYQQLREACEDDAKGRIASVAPELDFVESRKELIYSMEEALSDGRIPRRVIHGDTKLNNILFDEHGQVPLAVVDLDTCMPGYSLYDFGDLVRFTASTATEDEQDLSKVALDVELYRSLAKGYVDGVGDLLVPLEREWMPKASRLVTMTIGLRFLADYIAGDVYFHIERESHNLDRARVQFKLIESMEREEAKMRL